MLKGPKLIEETIRKTWAKLRQSLADKEFKYDEIDKALKSDFFKGLNEIFSQKAIMAQMTTDIKSLADNYRFCRGAKLYSDDDKNYERFIPNKEKMRAHNRFSPVGVEWLYLAFQSKQQFSTAALSLMEECCVKECQCKKGVRFGLCTFEMDDIYAKAKIVNLTIGDKYSYKELETQLELGMRSSNKELQVTAITNFAMNIYSKLLSEQIFVPLTTEDRELMYAPFWCLAQYFMQKGYQGIIYKSTVCKGAKNIVLFNKEIARPTGEIKDILV